MKIFPPGSEGYERPRVHIDQMTFYGFRVVVPHGLHGPPFVGVLTDRAEKVVGKMGLPTSGMQAQYIIDQCTLPSITFRKLYGEEPEEVPQQEWRVPPQKMDHRKIFQKFFWG